MTEVLDGVGGDRRGALVRVLLPRQLHLRLRDVSHHRLGRRSRERRRLRGAVEHHWWVGGRYGNKPENVQLIIGGGDSVITARKQSLRRLCFHKCLSVILFRGEGWCLPKGMLGYTADTPLGRHPTSTTGYGQLAGGTHPTGMHSC